MDDSQAEPIARRAQAEPKESACVSQQSCS